MLMIRLKRVGKKNDPSFRVVVTEKHRGPKSGKYIENIGSYNPQRNERNIDAGRAKHWIDNGAQTSGTVHNILVTEGIIDAPKKNVLPKGTPIVSEKEEEAPSSEDPTSAEADRAKENPEEKKPTETSEEKTENADNTKETEESDSTTDDTGEEEKVEKVEDTVPAKESENSDSTSNGTGTDSTKEADDSEEDNESSEKKSKEG